MGETCNCRQSDPSELHKLQLQYAWNWFSFHADQRTKIFNFMLVALGLVAAAIGVAIDKRIDPVAIRLLCGFGALLALAFVLLDKRNRELVWVGENLLADMELNMLFADRTPQPARYRIARAGSRAPEKLFVRGCVTSEAHAHGFDEDWWSTDPLASILRGKHRLLLPGIALMFALLFLLMGLTLGPVEAPKTSAPPALGASAPGG